MNKVACLTYEEAYLPQEELHIDGLVDAVHVSRLGGQAFLKGVQHNHQRLKVVFLELVNVRSLHQGELQPRGTVSINVNVRPLHQGELQPRGTISINVRPLHQFA